MNSQGDTIQSTAVTVPTLEELVEFHGKLFQDMAGNSL